MTSLGLFVRIWNPNFFYIPFLVIPTMYVFYYDINVIQWSECEQVLYKSCEFGYVWLPIVSKICE
jgi:hypothetical protein